MIEIPRKYPGKQDDDKVVLFVRKHWIKYLVVSIVSLLLFSIPLVAIIIYLLNKPVVDPMTTEIVTVSIGVYLLIVMGLILQAFVDFYLDMFIITEDKIIFVRQNGFFNQQIDESHIAEISEVGVDIKGIINSVVGCGDVVVHMGNDEAILTIDDIQHPEKVAKEITRLHKEFVGKGGNSLEGMNQDEYKDIIDKE